MSRVLGHPPKTALISNFLKVHLLRDATVDVIRDLRVTSVTYLLQDLIPYLLTYQAPDLIPGLMPDLSLDLTSDLIPDLMPDLMPIHESPP